MYDARAMHVYCTGATQVYNLHIHVLSKGLKGGFTRHMYMYVCISHVYVYSHSSSMHPLIPGPHALQTYAAGYRR